MRLHDLVSDDEIVEQLLRPAVPSESLPHKYMKAFEELCLRLDRLGVSSNENSKICMTLTILDELLDKKFPDKTEIPS